MLPHFHSTNPSENTACDGELLGSSSIWRINIYISDTLIFVLRCCLWGLTAGEEEEERKAQRE